MSLKTFGNYVRCVRTRLDQLCSCFWRPICSLPAPPASLLDCILILSPFLQTLLLKVSELYMKAVGKYFTMLNNQNKSVNAYTQLQGYTNSAVLQHGFQLFAHISVSCDIAMLMALENGQYGTAKHEDHQRVPCEKNQHSQNSCRSRQSAMAMSLPTQIIQCLKCDLAKPKKRMKGSASRGFGLSSISA
jgi:hypothetical protein